MADIAHGPKVGKRKAIEPLGLVAARSADRAQLKTPVAQGQSTAAPVVDSLNATVLQCAVNKIVAAGRSQVETHLARFADLQEGLQLLTLDRRGGAALFVNRVQHRMPESNRRAAPT